MGGHKIGDKQSFKIVPEVYVKLNGAVISEVKP